MQLSASALAQIMTLTQGANPNYPAAYAIALQDLTASNPNATGADADVLHWLAIALQVNSGATTAPAIAIRADNAAASALQLGKPLALFGPEEQAASNAVAKSFFSAIMPDGTVPTFSHIIQLDAQAGLGVLRLDSDAWAGAVPDAVASSPIVGFNTDNFYDSLSTAEQSEANVIHLIAADLITDEAVGLSLQLNQTEIDPIIETDEIVDTQQPSLGLFELSAGPIRLGGAALTAFGNLNNSLYQLFPNVTQGIAGTEADIQTLSGMNPGITSTTVITDAGPDVDLNLSTPSDPSFDIYVSSQNGPITVSGTAAVVEDITFLDNQGTAVVDSPLSYTGTIYSFMQGDTIDLAGIGTAATGAVLGANNVLTINGGTTSPVTLDLDSNENFAGELFSVASDGNSGSDITLVSIAPAAAATTAEASGSTFTAQSVSVSGQITWTGQATSSYSYLLGTPGYEDWTGVAGNMSSIIYGTSGYFPNAVLSALNAPAYYTTLGIQGVNASVLNTDPNHPLFLNGGAATDDISLTFSAPIPAGTGILLWGPGSFFTNGFYETTGPFTFTVSATLNSVAISTSGWTMDVENPSGGSPVWSYSANPATGQITINTTVNQNVLDPDAVIILTPNTPIDEINVSANTVLDNTWGLAVPTASLACFAEGVQIRTARGDVAVERLRIGDHVQLLLDGRSVPVVWIGYRHVDCRRHPQPEKVWPVRIAADAFGDCLPRHDLWLSPDHAVYVQEVLIPIKHLINDTSIAQVPVDEVTYYHIELPHHDLLLAEGMPAESYLDVGDRSNFENGGPMMRLFPDFSTPAVNLATLWEGKGCAPLVIYGPELESARALVNAQAVLTAAASAAA